MTVISRRLLAGKTRVYFWIFVLFVWAENLSVHGFHKELYKNKIFSPPWPCNGVSRCREWAYTIKLQLLIHAIHFSLFPHDFSGRRLTLGYCFTWRIWKNSGVLMTFDNFQAQNSNRMNYIFGNMQYAPCSCVLCGE